LFLAFNLKKKKILREYENLLKSLNEKNKVEKELKNNLGKRYSLFSKTQLNFQQFSAPEFSIITKESVSNQNSEEKILNQMTQLMKQFVNLLFEGFFFFLSQIFFFFLFSPNFKTIQK